jgi:hypothetical protein
MQTGNSFLPQIPQHPRPASTGPGHGPKKVHFSAEDRVQPYANTPNWALRALQAQDTTRYNQYLRQLNGLSTVEQRVPSSAFRTQGSEAIQNVKEALTHGPTAPSISETRPPTARQRSRSCSASLFTHNGKRASAHGYWRSKNRPR